jgi:hypothetical protein
MNLFLPLLFDLSFYHTLMVTRLLKIAKVYKIELPIKHANKSEKIDKRGHDT